MTGAGSVPAQLEKLVDVARLCSLQLAGVLYVVFGFGDHTCPKPSE